MSAPATLLTYGKRSGNAGRAHRTRVQVASIAGILMTGMLTVYGWDYYSLSAAERPFSPKHELLKPSGSIALKLGILGLLLFCLIFLYALRKRVPWLKNLGSARHWLDFHIVAGLTAPVLIAFHASFKFHGIAGVAFWFMVSVAVSGVVGRYVYAQIPRSLNSAEISLVELQTVERALTDSLAKQNVLTPADIAPLLRIPSAEQVRAMPMLRALATMVMLDVARPYRIASLRRRAKTHTNASITELDRVISLVREKSSLSKRVTFLARTRDVFHLWHVIHRPFSYSFAVLALLHIVVVFALGFV